MLRGRHIAQKICSSTGCDSPTDAGGDMVPTAAHIRDQGPQNIKRSSPAYLFFQYNILFDLIQRHVPRPLDHHLHVSFPAKFGEVSQYLQFRKLGFIRGIQNRTRPQPVSQAQTNIVLIGDIQDLIEILKKRVFAFMPFHPIR
ncbi:MAG: hypothetical protein AMJ95_09860 [Omnitrophica WOR_2 bacterium SM23_72]|nr:MAG: hypothetical protein AMJ95_09860 [Omnitrophica WOR_2 bacterium SM23_72]